MVHTEKKVRNGAEKADGVRSSRWDPSLDFGLCVCVWLVCLPEHTSHMKGIRQGKTIERSVKGFWNCPLKGNK